VPNTDNSIFEPTPTLTPDQIVSPSSPSPTPSSQTSDHAATHGTPADKVCNPIPVTYEIRNLRKN
jgi:hypothetical protein